MKAKKLGLIVMILCGILFVSCEQRKNQTTGQNVTNVNQVNSKDNNSLNINTDKPNIGTEPAAIDADSSTNMKEDIGEYKDVYTDCEEQLPSLDELRLMKNGIMMHMVSSEQLAEFTNKLLSDGYIQVKEKAGSKYLYYSKGIELIRILDCTKPKEKLGDLYSFTHVMVNTNAEEILSDESRMNEEIALTIVQACRTDLSVYPDTRIRIPSYVSEIYIPDLYEKTGMQAFTGYDGNGNELGNYLIYEDCACRISDYLYEAAVCDVDEDGTYELISLYGFGFGIYRDNLTAYRVITGTDDEKPVISQCYKNCFVPKNGYGELTLFKDAANRLHLAEEHVEVLEDREVSEIVKDYGNLIVGSDGIHLEPEKSDDFPYYTWDEVYNSQNFETDTNVGTLNELPTFNISVGDTKINIQSTKLDWNDEHYETLSFKDLMNAEEIERFPNPKSGENTEFCLEFPDVVPTSIEVEDYLLTQEGREIFNKSSVENRYLREEKKGTYYLALTNHIAMALSSSMLIYSNPSYRGFKVICSYGENQTCEYDFVISMEAMLKNN